MSEKQIAVEVVYALPLAQDSTRLRVPAGTTVAEAIAQAGVALRHPGLELADNRVAVYGKRVLLTTVLRDQDRVEILRPLTADPREARRRRAARGRSI
ncbi:MAG TPA: RnfH family protein [Burkholderiales bacterium]|nr:RnfH family protein [Burkholderiales bacterium]